MSTTSMPDDHAARLTILTAHHETLFVEAGAGTGKTTALVGRVVDMVATGDLADISALAAITFTENAASELRSRLRAGLADAARGEHRGRRYGRAEQARAATALVAFDDAAVTTIHGFAARILAHVPLEAGLPPGFVVRDPVAAQVDATRAWRRFLDHLLGDAAIANHVRAGLTLGLTTDALREVADAFAGSWDILAGRPFREVPLPAVDVAPLVAALRAATADADRWPAGDALSRHLRTEVMPFLAALESCHDDDDLLATLAERALTCGRGTAQAWRRVGLDKGVVTSCLGAAEATRAAAVAAVGRAVTETLAARVQAFVLDGADRRREAGGLDFHDLLVFARNVLRDDDGARALVAERWRVIMIDEFQDTDPLQVEIVDLLAADRPRFYVGDAKQSIYRFRRADVALYTQVGAAHADARVVLDVNFRSVPGILDVVNRVFPDLFRTSEWPVPCSDLRGSRAATVDGPVVTILGGPDAGGADDRRRREAAHLADLLVRAHDGWLIEDGTGGLRPPRFADMAVLLPTRLSLPAIESALHARDVPYRIESRSLVWSSDAVRDLVTILSAVANPSDQPATAAALRHPGLACTDVHLAEWAAARGSWSALAPAPEGMADHPVAAGLATLRRLHDLRWWLPVPDLVALIVRDLRLVELTAELHRPRDHWRRLRFVVDQARAFTDAGGSGLSSFVAWARTQEDAAADVLETAVPEPDDDAVRILTIHGAKGLEFPVTAVAGLGSQGGGPARVLWGGAGRGAEVQLKAKALLSAGWPEAHAREKVAAGDEALRLLYVAMTRARDYLILGCYHNQAKSGNSNHAQALVKRLPEDCGLVRVEPKLTGPGAGASEPAGGADPAPHEPAPARHASGPVLEGAPPAEPAPPARARPAVVLGHETFDEDRAALLAAVAARVATTPTALVIAADPTAAAGPAAGRGPTARPPDADHEPLSDDADAAEPREVTTASDGTQTLPSDPTPRRRRPRGAAIGTAVHRVLELVEPDDPDDVIRRLTALACEESGIPELAADVADRVRGVLAGPAGEALARGHARREVYLVVPDGERIVEGFVDLLVEDEDGLRVLDYKTDAAPTESARAAKRAYYAPQLTAYARMVHAVTGRLPSTGLVFAAPTGPGPTAPARGPAPAEEA